MMTNVSNQNESVKIVSGKLDVANGSAGMASHVPGQATSVSAMAEATGGIGGDGFIATSIDEELFRFNSEDTPLMNLMLKAKRVNVNSPVVEHYMIDEPRSTVRLATALMPTTTGTAMLPLSAADTHLLRSHTTLLVKGVNGYDAEGKKETPGRDLMLFVTGIDSQGQVWARAVNGKRSNSEEEYSQIPPLPEGTPLVILANSLYETQKEVDPEMIVPTPTTVYLQKRGMNQVVSDYFESQRKRIPFSKAVIAEQAIANFKVRGNRTLWASRAGKFKMEVPKMGLQTCYTTEGLRWQFKRELQETGTWTIDKIIALAKMFFTGEDVPKSAILLAGKNLLEKIQKIDYSGHPEIQISTKVNSVGWTVTNFHTVFGDIEIKREPTLDRLGWSNSGALIGDNRLVHYVYSAEHSFEDRVAGEEATRSGILIWDALALKGTCHIWIDGDSTESSGNAERIILWETGILPQNPVEGTVYYFTAVNVEAGIRPGRLYRAEKDESGETIVWKEVVTEV